MALHFKVVPVGAGKALLRQGQQFAVFVGGQAIDVVFVVFVAARIDGGAAIVVGQHAQAGGFARELVQRFDVAVLDLLVGDDADGLRDFALRRRDFGADGGSKGTVIAAVFGSVGAIAALGFDEDGV